MPFALRLLVSWLFLAAAIEAVAAAPVEAPEAMLVIVGDQHSAYDRLAQFVAEIDRLKEEHHHVPLAVLVNGDAFEYGNVVARRSGGQVDFAALAALAKRVPVVVNLGNHEMDFFGPAETVRRLREAGVTVLGGNARARAGEAPLAPPSVVLELGPYKITVVGVMTDRLSTFRLAIRPELDLADPVVWAKRHFPALLQDAALPVVLSHSGVRADRELLPLVPGGTLFAGAHDHLRFHGAVGLTHYVHSGSWMECYTLARLRWSEGHRLRWQVEQRSIDPRAAGDRELAALVREVRARHLTPEDQAVVARLPRAMTVEHVGNLAALAIARAAGVDTGFVGNTTFGSGLPEGAVMQVDFDASVRFDGPIYTAAVDGARLRQLIETMGGARSDPLAQGSGEFSFFGGKADAIDPAGTYRIATTDWGAKNTDRYFGAPTIAWQEHPTVKLKAAVLSLLAETK